MSAHDNVYERTKPQNGITYFVVGSGGKAPPRKTSTGTVDLLPAVSISDLAFLAAEIIGGRMHFNAICRTGETVESGVVTRRE